ncbi:MerR family DNA-binding protein [Phenylobacterium ferrooxidans]|uniref:MerR family DNA-binding protein n=1 Tax=Phenylobacterium ferrooxidans TaxID=2982689 RepID=A0ABW6CUC9_9CAUL
MNIGRAAEASGVSAKMIRYYERIGLVRPADRTDGNYRSFGPREVHELTFIRRARDLGFSVEEITQLLELWRERERPAEQVHATANLHLADLEARIAGLQALADVLRDLSEACAKGERPEAPILPKAIGLPLLAADRTGPRRGTYLS